MARHHRYQRVLTTGMQVWQQLGIAPTRDMAVIRRAYAVRLKQIRVADDPAGFAQLRAAYEAAMAIAQRGAPPRDPPAPPVAAPPVAAPPVADTKRIDPPPQHTLMRDAPKPDTPAPDMRAPDMRAPDMRAPDTVAADTPPVQRSMDPQLILAALRIADVASAADLIVRGRDAGTLPLADEMRLSDQLCQALTTDRTLPAAAVLAAATRMGWYGKGASAAPALRALVARIDAEQWLERLRAAAGALHAFWPANRRIAARLLLGRGRVWESWIFPPNPPLRELYAEYLLHARWTAAAFDPARIDTVRRIVTGRYTRRAPVIITCLFWAAILAATHAIGIACFGASYRFARRLAARQGRQLTWTAFAVSLARPMLRAAPVYAAAVVVLLLLRWALASGR